MFHQLDRHGGIEMDEGQVGKRVDDVFATQYTDVALGAVLGLLGFQDQSTGGVIIPVDQGIERSPQGYTFAQSPIEAEFFDHLLSMLVAGVG